MKKNPPHLALLSLAASLSGTAMAAPPPGIGEAVQQAQPVVQPKVKAPPPSVEALVPTEPPLQSLPGNQPSVTVTEFAFSGNVLFTDDALQQLVADARGKQLTVAQLHDLATRVTRAYRNAGYFVARAYVPAQELVGGSVKIRVIEGHYGDFILDHHGRLNKATAQAILDAVKARDIVSVDTLERAMLVLNDTPGVHVTKVSVSPGQKVGTSDFNVQTEATPAWSGAVALDNHGSVYTGKNRLSFSGAWEAPTQAGDRLDLFAMTTERNGLDSGRLGYWHLLTPTGLRGEIALARTTYNLGDTYSALDAIGHANSVDGQLTYPLILNETRRLTANVGASYSSLVDEVRSTQTRTPKKVQAAHSGLEYSSLAPEASTLAGASVTVGHLGFQDAVASSQDEAGAATRGIFSKLNVHIERLQSLPAGFELTLRARAQVDLSAKSLDGSQKLEVSGADGVIVYAPGELLGDTAAVARLAIGRAIAAAGDFKLSANVFIDEGWAHNHHAVAGSPTSRTLGDAGLGIAASFKSVSLQVQWAARTQGGKAVAEPTSSSRVLAQLSAAF